jgi:hypothetical protein
MTKNHTIYSESDMDVMLSLSKTVDLDFSLHKKKPRLTLTQKPQTRIPGEGREPRERKRTVAKRKPIAK